MAQDERLSSYNVFFRSTSGNELHVFGCHEFYRFPLPFLCSTSPPYFRTRVFESFWGLPPNFYPAYIGPYRTVQAKPHPSLILPTTRFSHSFSRRVKARVCSAPFWFPLLGHLRPRCVRASPLRQAEDEEVAFWDDEIVEGDGDWHGGCVTKRLTTGISLRNASHDQLWLT